MPTLKPLPGFIGPGYLSQSPTVDVERTVNLLLTHADAGNPKTDMWFEVTPGTNSFLVANDVHRPGGAFSLNGRAFIVCGDTLSEVFADKTRKTLGTVGNDGLPVSMASNGPGGNQLMVVSAGKGYIFNLSTGVFAQITDPDFFPNVGMCGFLDGYFLVNQKNTAKFQISVLEDGTSWDPLDIAQKNQTNDYILSLIVDVDRKVVRLIGSQNTEIWWDAGTATFPFEAVPNAMQSMGTIGPFAWAQPDDAVTWIGESTNGSRTAFEAGGLSAQRVSTHAVEAVWSTYSRVDDCYAWTCEYRGHSLSVFTFPTVDATWVYDRTEKTWFEWLYWDVVAGVYRAHLACSHMYAFNQHLVGSRLDANLHTLSSDYLSDNGAAIRRLRRSPHVESANYFLFCSELRFGFQVGVGLVSGQGSDPQIMLRISRDGGRTWGNERWRSLGKMGDYRRRVRYLANGGWRDGVLELTVSDPTVIAITECDAAVRRAAA